MDNAHITNKTRWFIDIFDVVILTRNVKTNKKRLPNLLTFVFIEGPFF